MRSTFSGFFFLRDLFNKTIRNTLKIQPVEIKSPAVDNNEKKDKDDDEGESYQDHGIVDKHPICENI